MILLVFMIDVFPKWKKKNSSDTLLKYRQDHAH